MTAAPSVPSRVGRALTIGLVAGEESGDRLGAALMEALAQRYQGELKYTGVGGQAMAAAGLVSLFAIDELSIMGFAAIPHRLASILRRIRETSAAMVASRPDVLVIIDSPEFTHRVARRVRAAAPSIPILDYVSPSVWAWRPGRARTMRRYVDHVLAILPFEPAAHARLGGPPCTYVGHPLIEQVGELRPNETEAQRREAPPPVVLVLPGSRQGEVRRLLDVFAATIGQVSERLGKLDIVLPTLPALKADVVRATAGWPQPPRVIDDAREKQACFRVARAALAASGTVTLELALAGVPMVAAYRVVAWEAAIGRRLITASSVILANLVLGEDIVPQFLQENCAPEKLVDPLAALIGPTAERRRQLQAFARLDAIMEIGTARPSLKAADLVLGAAGSTNPRMSELVS